MRLKNVFEIVKGGFKKFSGFIQTIVNSVLLTVVYILGIGLTSIFSKIFGKKFLNLKPENKQSHWLDKKIEKQEYDKYLRQF